MTIEYSNGKTVDVENMDEAREILETEYPNAVFSSWEYNAPENY